MLVCSPHESQEAMLRQIYGTEIFALTVNGAWTSWERCHPGQKVPGGRSSLRALKKQRDALRRHYQSQYFIDPMAGITKAFERLAQVLNNTEKQLDEPDTKNKTAG